MNQIVVDMHDEKTNKNRNKFMYSTAIYYWTQLTFFCLVRSLSRSISRHLTSLKSQQTLTEGDTKQIIISCLFLGGDRKIKLNLILKKRNNNDGNG